MSNYLHLVNLRESILTRTSFPHVSGRGSDATVALLSGSGTAVDHGPPKGTQDPVRPNSFVQSLQGG